MLTIDTRTTSGVFNVYFEHISNHFLCFYCYLVQVNVFWDTIGVIYNMLGNRLKFYLQIYAEHNMNIGKCLSLLGTVETLGQRHPEKFHKVLRKAPAVVPYFLVRLRVKITSGQLHLKLKKLILFSHLNSFMTEVPIKQKPANQWTGFYLIGTSVMNELKGT